MKLFPLCLEALYAILLSLALVKFTAAKIYVCLPDDSKNKTCSRLLLPDSLFRPRLIPPRPFTIASDSAMDGYTRRLTAYRTRVCAWLERGGIFDSALVPLPRRRALLHGRLHCSSPSPTSATSSRWGPAPTGCNPRWADYDDPHMRLYEFQLHTCGNLYSPLSHPYCLSNRVAFELQQRGTQLYLNDFRCRCKTPAEILEITYSKPLPPTKRIIEPRFISMTCRAPPPCRSLTTPCFYEIPNAEGFLTSGIYACQCPRRYFCDAYHMRKPRMHSRTNTGKSIYFTFCQLSLL
ncbi:unnamed protein product [Mesocestoides corti]|uniref:DUF5731 domain-containing protein n=1 Tax=Mesocestoides corti TaxID=53468 RepID=A0A0R3UH88_MESCO|nr:unnamed protein product [Mesocestoides corti]